LEVRCGDEIREFPLAQGTITIGRAEDNQVVLSDSLVSRYHAQVDVAEEAYHIRDLGSANGTRIDEVEADPKVPYPLHDGAIVTIGGSRLVLRLSDGSGDETRIYSNPEATQVSGAGATDIIAPSHPHLTITTPRSSNDIPLERDVLTLGRDPASDLVIDDSVVSRHHAELRRAGMGYEVIDMGSANGLTIGGEPIRTKALVDGDVLWIGTTVSLTYKSVLGAEEETVAPLRLERNDRHVTTIGRHPQNDIALDHPTVSRVHARIAWSDADGAHLVEDLGSSNGTFVNGQPILSGATHPLRSADTIRIGPVKFVYAPDRLEQVDESRNLRLDALHLNRVVGKGLNLLQDISLSIHPHEFVAVVGVSGAGKSTLLDALNGFRPATAGAVLVNETDLYRNFNSYRSDLGYVPQDDIIHKELTVYKALDYAARLRLPPDTAGVERHERVETVLETLGLGERRDVPIQSLSGGQRKRVSIGSELLTRPGLFFLDEATSGLDPGTESQMMRLLRKLADQGHTILLVTHATKNVMLCDQVVFLAKGGHLAYFGPPDQALTYFEVDDFDGIYEKLENELTPATWGEKFSKSDQYQEFVVGRLRERYGDLVHTPPAKNVIATGGGKASGAIAAASPRVSTLRQFWILSSRYVNIIRRDRMTVLLLFLIAPAIGTIDLIAWPRSLFDVRDGDAIRAMTMLFLAALMPFLVGAAGSVREIVKEAPVYRRERTVSLRLLPYLTSKVWVGFLFSLYHALALFAFKFVAIDFSHLGGADMAQFYVTLVLAAMSGVMWGLLISAIVPREDQAMFLVMAVVVVQMVFSGGLLPLSQLGIAGEVLGDLSSTKWVYEALTAAGNVKTGICDGVSLVDCQLPGLQAYATDAERRVALEPMDERYGGVFGANVYVAWGALTAIISAVLLLILAVQKRKDVF
jgi:ABC-type multidrug transport system ATPase subunit